MSEVPRGARLTYLLSGMAMGRPNDTLVIVETGSIRQPGLNWAQSDGHSTLYLADWARWMRMGGRTIHLHSIDRDISVADKVLRDHGLRHEVSLSKGDAADILLTFPEIHFAYLDTFNDEDAILEQFKIVEERMASGGVVVIDDYDPDPTNHHKQNGRKAVPYAREKGYPVLLDLPHAIISIPAK